MGYEPTQRSNDTIEREGKMRHANQANKCP